jgi:hypothetical protein
MTEIETVTVTFDEMRWDAHPDDANFEEKMYELLREAGMGPPRPPSL